MGELLISVIAVFAALSVHFLIWKMRVPVRQTRAILIIFFSVLGVVVATLPLVVSYFSPPGLSLPLHPATYLHIICFVTAAALAYMITYTVIEVDSPSLVMALAISNAGDAGLPEVDFCAMMSDTLLVEPRIRDMVRDGLALKDGEIYRLTSKGRRMVRLFVLHRRLLGAGMGG